MKTQNESAKTPLPPDNGDSVKRSDPGRDTANESPSLGINQPKEGELSAILSVSKRLMAALHKSPRKVAVGLQGKPVIHPPVAKMRNPTVSRRLRDWDTHLFVLSTLKRLVDQEHFEEQEEEDNQVRFTREALQMRRQMIAEQDKRQHRRLKIEKILPAMKLTGKKIEEGVLINTRDKQRLEKSKKLLGKRLSTKAGMALNDALNKVAFIKDPHIDDVIPEEINEKAIEVTLQKNEIVEQQNEVKNENRTKRGFFKFTGKRD